MAEKAYAGKAIGGPLHNTQIEADVPVVQVRTETKAYLSGDAGLPTLMRIGSHGFYLWTDQANAFIWGVFS